MICIISLFALVTISFFILLYTLLNRSYRKYYVPLKMMNSTVFLITALYCGLASGNTAGLFRILPAFILCYVGDLALGFHNKTLKKRYMLAGTGLFLLAHVFFLIYLYEETGGFLTSFSFLDLLMPVLGVITVLTISFKDQFTLTKFRVPACLYGFFVCGLAWKSLLIAVNSPSPSHIAFAIGGLFFLMSDGLIIPLYFKKSRGFTIHGFNLATYYVAMFSLGLSLFL